MNHLKTFESFFLNEAEIHGTMRFAHVDDDELEMLQQLPQFNEYLNDDRIAIVDNDIWLKEDDKEIAGFLIDHLPSLVTTEGKIRKFITGHGTKEERDESEKEFLKNLEEAENDIKQNPEKYAQSKNWNSTKSMIIKKAKDNNYKGKLRVQTSRKDNKKYIIYSEGKSGFQQLASAAARSASGE